MELYIFKESLTLSDTHWKFVYEMICNLFQNNPGVGGEAWGGVDGVVHH